jgi:hypothetical protein
MSRSYIFSPPAPHRCVVGKITFTYIRPTQELSYDRIRLAYTIFSTETNKKETVANDRKIKCRNKIYLLPNKQSKLTKIDLKTTGVPEKNVKRTPYEITEAESGETSSFNTTQREISETLGR